MKKKNFKLVQVFDWLKMPSQLNDEFLDWAECDNGAYIRWYPVENSIYIKSELKDKVNNWLLENGMEVDTNDQYFYVLIHVSW